MVVRTDYVSHALPSCVLICQQSDLGNNEPQCTVNRISIVINALHEPAVVQGCLFLYVQQSILHCIACFVKRQSKAVANCCSLHPDSLTACT